MSEIDVVLGVSGAEGEEGPDITIFTKHGFKFEGFVGEVLQPGMGGAEETEVILYNDPNRSGNKFDAYVIRRKDIIAVRQHIDVRDLDGEV